MITFFSIVSFVSFQRIERESLCGFSRDALESFVSVETKLDKAPDVECVTHLAL